MKVHISVNDADTLNKLNRLSPEAYVEAWAEAILQLAKKNAREKLGGNFGAKTIAGSVEQQSSGLTAEVYTGGPSGYIGEAVHKGGMFRSRLDVLNIDCQRPDTSGGCRNRPCVKSITESGQIAGAPAFAVL